MYQYQPIQPVVFVPTAPFITSLAIAQSTQAIPLTLNAQGLGLQTPSSNVDLQQPSVSRISQPQASLPLSQDSIGPIYSQPSPNCPGGQQYYYQIPC